MSDADLASTGSPLLDAIAAASRRAAQGPMLPSGLVVAVYPCDRGGGLRGFHHFQANDCGVCCIYCGKRGTDD